MIDLTLRDADRIAGLLNVQATHVQRITDLEIVNAALRRTLAEYAKAEERVKNFPPSAKVDEKETASVRE